MDKKDWFEIQKELHIKQNVFVLLCKGGATVQHSWKPLVVEDLKFLCPCRHLPLQRETKMNLFVKFESMTLRQERELRGLINQFSSDKIFDLCEKG